MKSEFTFDNLPMGYSTEFHHKTNPNNLNIQLTGHATSDDGEHLIK